MEKRKAKAIPFSQPSQDIGDDEQHHSLSENDEHEVLQTHNDGLDDVEDPDATIFEAPTIIAKPLEHSPMFGNYVYGWILEEVVESFIVKIDRDPPHIPLSKRMKNETICAVGPGTEALAQQFERVGYSVLSAPFIISFKKPGHDQQYVTDEDMLEWGPIWQEINVEFEANLPLEWADLKNKKFFVWDGNHRLKTWLHMIKTRKWF